MQERNVRIIIGAVMWLVLCASPPRVVARMPIDPAWGPADKALVLDGSAVLTAGHLHLNVTNWGLLGSHYSVPSSYFNAPSGQWPGGSGHEYIFGAGLWVGGRQFGVTSVSSGQPESELRPPFLHENVMYEARDGMIRRPRVSSAITGVPGDLNGGDDDGDGLRDEDRMDGRDNDGDGRIDEDFAQRGSQMFGCIMRDDDPIADQLFPDHRPLRLEIYQEACAFDSPGAEDAVGLRWIIKNAGPQPIYDIYVGLLVDGDIGRHDDPDGGKDDLAGTFDGLVRQRDNYWEDLSYAWMRDADSVSALEGWLGAEIDGSGFGDPQAVRPEKHGTHAIRILNADFTQGYSGIPFLDSERYELLSRPGRDRDVEDPYPNDYVVLLSVGPYGQLDPGEYIVVEGILTVAVGQEDLQNALRRARDLADGRWYNADSYWNSGRNGGETLICAEDFAQPWNVPNNPLFRRFASYWNEDCKPSGMGAGWPIEATNLRYYPETDKHCIWISTDNCEECERYFGRPCTVENPGSAPCSRNSRRARGACTGQFGNEAKLPFVVRSHLPPPPLLRIEPVDRGMEIYWDDLSQRTPDALTGIPDFESYRVWRADEWDRPAGTSEDTGPPVLDWSMVGEYDLVNFFPHDPDEFPRSFGRNTGLAVVNYRPVCLDDPRFEGLADAMAEIVLADFTGEMEELPPLRNPEGIATPGLETLLPWEDYPAHLDTFFAVTERPFEVGAPKKAVNYYMHHDGPLHNGFVYFYAVTATDHQRSNNGQFVVAAGGGTLPSGSFGAGQPRFEAAGPGEQALPIYAYPNPATRESLADFQSLHPNAGDPTGVRISFANLPACQSVISIYTLAGDLVETIDHDGAQDGGQAYWNLITRNGQEVTSGIYMFVVQPEQSGYNGATGKFVVVR